MFLTFLQYLALYGLIVFVEVIGAYCESWLFASQVRKQENTPKKFLDLWRHGGIQSDFWLVNPLTAYIFTTHGNSWHMVTIVTSIVLTGIASLPLVKAWVNDDVPSALARNKSVTIPGGIMHYFYMPMTIGPIVLYFICPAYVSTWEVVVITGLLMVHWFIGLVQPAWVVHGTVHTQAKVLTVVGWLILLALAGRMIYFA